MYSYFPECLLIQIILKFHFLELNFLYIRFPSKSALLMYCIYISYNDYYPSTIKKITIMQATLITMLPKVSVVIIILKVIFRQKYNSKYVCMQTIKLLSIKQKKYIWTKKTQTNYLTKCCNKITKLFYFYNILRQYLHFPSIRLPKQYLHVNYRLLIKYNLKVLLWQNLEYQFS